MKRHVVFAICCVACAVHANGGEVVSRVDGGLRLNQTAAFQKEIDELFKVRKEIKALEEKLSALEGIDRDIMIASPIIAAGDVCGAVVLLQSETGEKANDTDMKLVSVAATFLGRQVES